MNVFADLKGTVLDAVATLQATGELPEGLDLGRVIVEPPREPKLGDAATNAALVLAKPARRNPMEIGERLAAVLATRPRITGAEVARPGFVNLRLDDDLWREQLLRVLEAGEGYGVVDQGEGRAVNVEYCSANPTGPLHVGHVRGTVFGDALANLLERMGWRVTREYYVNDSGAQIDTLARSLHFRYREALGEAVGAVPEGYYPGDYLVPVGEAIAKREGARWREAPEADWLEAFRDEAVRAMLALIKDDLAALGVRHEVFTSEHSLVERGAVEETLAFLEGKGLIYTGTLPPPKGKPVEDWEPVPQQLFRATDFGDDVDRPLRRSTGAWTYFAADVAYHRDKVERGFGRMIDVWGADHGGYIKRMQAAVAALTDREATLQVLLCQLVNLLDAGQPLRMSKRAGRIVTLRDVVDEVGSDVIRFIMLTRKNDAPLDFDLAKVVEQSRDNPVFYVQYAHARICSVFRHARTAGLDTGTEALSAADLSLLRDDAELALIKTVAAYPRVLESAAEQCEPHRITFYLLDLAAAFHALWTSGKEQTDLRFLRSDDADLSRARLAMLEAVRLVIAAGLGILGVRPVEELH